MGPELENKQNTDMILEASAKKQNGTNSKELVCASNQEDNASLVKQVEGVHGGEDVEIDVTECTNAADNVLVESDWDVLAESSSSFESIVSGAENCTTMSDAEYTSEYNGDVTSELAFSGLGDIFRMPRKKLTPHWREFIQPYRRLCKLVELKLHTLQSRARKYEKQMQDLNCQKQLQLGSAQVEGLGSKSVPFSCNRISDKVVKRKKRRRDEDTLDIAAYMSKHPLFYFFDKRKSIADGSFPDNELGKIAICSDKINVDVEFGIQDDLYEQPADDHTSLEKMLREIGVLQSRVSQLKTRLEKVTSENAGMFASSEDLNALLQCNALTSSAGNSAPLSDDQVKTPVGSRDVVSQLISEYNMVMPNNAASNRGEAMNDPDVIESTDRPFYLDTNTNMQPEDGVLIYNQRMNEEMSNFEGFNIQSEEKPKVSEHVQKDDIPTDLPEPDPELPLDDQPAPKIRSISKLTAPKSKKRKGRRRARRS